MLEDDGIKLGTIVRVGMLIALGCLIVICTVFESQVQALYPWFSGEGVLTASVLFVGIVYTVMDRQLMVGLLAVAAAIAIPMMFKFFRMYWAWASQGDPLLRLVSKIAKFFAG